MRFGDIDLYFDNGLEKKSEFRTRARTKSLVMTHDFERERAWKPRSQL